jgi:lysine N6-hydroxylase
LVADQWRHYKGISTETLEQIHDLLYQRELAGDCAPVELRCAVAVEGAAAAPSGEVVLACRHTDTGAAFERRTDVVIAATGYRQRKPSFLAPLERLLRVDEHGRLRVALDYGVELSPHVRGRLFVVNAELHTHGVATPDLGISAFRNARILNTIVGREVYRLPRKTSFQTFEAPRPGDAEAWRPPSGARATATSFVDERREVAARSTSEVAR